MSNRRILTKDTIKSHFQVLVLGTYTAHSQTLQNGGVVQFVLGFFIPFLTDMTQSDNHLI